MTANSPRAILERLAFACFLALLIASMGLAGVGFIFGLHGGDARPALFGIAGLLLTLAVRPLGYKHLHFRKWEDSFEPVDGCGAFGPDPLLGERAQAFAEALANLETLQQQIAAGEADVWAVQQARHDVAAMLGAEPALREVFAAELASHPELA
jgi:hypothetical protein